ncbi:UxaA family hydrolase [Psychromonas sp. GE-S-Ul-11]|uniref:UxaA family hydrolase n=1 Tax=Psychromonas sp. GE-S-Ul-11 TaxID=3241170 RepID=UPI00390CC8FB
MKQFTHIHPTDNVIIALKDIETGQVININGQSVIAKEMVGRGHKIAIKDINNAESIIKYGSPIGHAIEDIKSGQIVHTHNIKTNLSNVNDYQYKPKPVHFDTHIAEREIQAYQRNNGEIGIRNELWVIPTVGCVNGISQQIVNRFIENNPQLLIDGIYVFPHQFGCSQLGDDHENTKKILADMALHPNAGGVLVIGLGCENNQVEPLKELLGDYDEQRIHFMVTQQEMNEVEVGLEHINEIYQIISQDKRSPCSIGKLRIGLECGGSDGLSGITANPLLGVISDYLVTQGGTTVLTEVPEMFGAEHILFERCINEDIFNKAVAMVNEFKQYFIDHNQPIYENPSPGNKSGGISTLEDKSLGCTQKAGNSPVVDVLKYGELLKTPGLNLLSAPGNDAIATSALAASGCHLVLFTTGRGTPYGGFVPTVKISTNSDLFQRKGHWIDFNAGSLVEGGEMIDISNDFLNEIIKIVNGQKTCNEKNNIRELALFKSGVTL